MDANEKDIKRTEQFLHPSHPLLSFDDVFDNEVVARLGKRRYGPVKPFKKGFPHSLPGKLARLDPL